MDSKRSHLLIAYDNGGLPVGNAGDPVAGISHASPGNSAGGGVWFLGIGVSAWSFAGGCERGLRRIGALRLRPIEDPESMQTGVDGDGQIIIRKRRQQIRNRSAVRELAQG